LVLVRLRTNLTTRALAALFHTSQSTVDRIIHHLVPVLARSLRPNPDQHRRPWIIDGTLIPVHDQTITAVSNNYRCSINTQILIHRVHHRIRARVEHVIAPLKDWQILRQCRRRGHAINHSLQITAGLWNLKTFKQLLVNS
jgi:Helix-turn-helix of DDE superfamily endonuclease